MAARPTREQALDACVRTVELGLAEQAARPPVDAARAALGPKATDQQIHQWLAAFRPAAVRSTA